MTLHNFLTEGFPYICHADFFLWFYVFSAFLGVHFRPGPGPAGMG
jgi:hypothetical protein